MVLSPIREMILRPGYEGERRRFIEQLPRALGATPTAGYLTHHDDLLTSVCPWSGRVWTADATMAQQIRPRKRGFARLFTAASGNYLNTPDTANMSFGNGTVDSPFSVMAFQSVGPVAAARDVLSKWNVAPEYIFQVNANSQLVLSLATAGVVQIGRTSTGAIRSSTFRLHTATYDGTGGATAANGIVLYEDEEVMASAPTNSGLYVAMANGADLPEIGSISNHSTEYHNANLGFLCVVAGVLTQARISAAMALCRRLFGGA